MAVKNKPTVKVEQFFGVNNRDKDVEFGLKAFSDAQNCDVTRARKIKRRKGFQQVYDASGNLIQAAWFDADGWPYGYIQLADGNLYEIDVSYNTRVLDTGLDPVVHGALVGHRIEDTVYLSNGRKTWVIEERQARSWGLPWAYPPSVEAIAGGELRAGTYGLAVTFHRGNGLLEGGARIPVYVVVADGQGLRLTNIPTHPDALGRYVYVTAPDGEEFFLVERLGADETEYTYRGSGKQLGVSLETLYHGPPPAGQAVTHLGSRMLVASGPYLYDSNVYNYELFNPRRFAQFGSPINVLGAVLDGVYVGTNREIVFLQGSGVTDFRRIPIANYGAYRGTLVETSADRIGTNDLQGEAVLFATSRGFAAGFNGGSFKNLTVDHFELPAANRGTAMLRDEDGQHHYVSVIETT